MNYQPGITLVTACMDRNSKLDIVLASWLKVKEIDCIIIVDWSSKIPVKEIVDRYLNSKSLNSKSLNPKV